MSGYCRENDVNTCQLKIEVGVIIVVDNDNLPPFSGEMWFGLKIVNKRFLEQ